MEIILDLSFGIFDFRQIPLLLFYGISLTQFSRSETNTKLCIRLKQRSAKITLIRQSLMPAATNHANRLFSSAIYVWVYTNNTKRIR